MKEPDQTTLRFAQFQMALLAWEPWAIWTILGAIVGITAVGTLLQCWELVSHYPKALSTAAYIAASFISMLLGGNVFGWIMVSIESLVERFPGWVRESVKIVAFFCVMLPGTITFMAIPACVGSSMAHYITHQPVDEDDSNEPMRYGHLVD